LDFGKKRKKRLLELWFKQSSSFDIHLPNS